MLDEHMSYNGHMQAHDIISLYPFLLNIIALRKDFNCPKRNVMRIVTNATENRMFPPSMHACNAFMSSSHVMPISVPSLMIPVSGLPTAHSSHMMLHRPANTVTAVNWR